MEQKNNKYYSYISEYYAANPTKFEKRKNNLKPVLYLGLAVVGAVLAIFPGLLPLAGWLVRTAGIIMTLVCLIAAYLNNFDIYNFQSGGKVKSMGVKKFKRDETNPAKIVEAFLSRNFEYLADLPGGRSEPVQLHIEEDATGREMYCLLTTYDSDSNIVGLADVITLSGNDYDDNIDLIDSSGLDYKNSSEEKKTLLNGRKNTRKKNIHTIKEIDRRGGYRHK